MSVLPPLDGRRDTTEVHFMPARRGEAVHYNEHDGIRVYLLEIELGAVFEREGRSYVLNAKYYTLEPSTPRYPRGQRSLVLVCDPVER